MIFGYARVSTSEQNIDIQIDSLRGADCERIYQEKLSSKSTERAELEAMLGQSMPSLWPKRGGLWNE